MKKIDSFFEKCSNKLLDLGNRNPLVNFKQTKSGCFRFETPSMNEIWSRIVGNNAIIDFTKDLDINIDEDTNCKDDSGCYEINKKTNEAYRVLKNLRQKAKTSIDEQGVNTLYLAFGLIEWYESSSSDIPKYAPLLLVPIAITHESATAPFRLSLADDDIVVNPSMKYKLLEEFDLELPEYEDQDLNIYFQQVRESLKKYPRWNLEETVVCSVFSFLKLSMFEFLKKYRELILANSLIKALAGLKIDTPNYLCLDENTDYDSVISENNILQVVDADSSQLTAMLRAHEGVSFVLQGPPGTGKSQTITNIIASSIADGKKVLFVSEKSAALDVVYNKLKAVKLADFCLPLHSHKANKKVVLLELENALKNSGKKAKLTDSAYAKINELEDEKEKLNSYDHELHEVINPLGKSIYDVYGILASVENAPSLSFEIEDIKHVTAEQYFDILSCIRKLGGIKNGLTLNPLENPWYGARDVELTNKVRGDFKSNLEKAERNIEDVLSFYQDTYGSLNLDQEPTLNNISELYILCSLASQKHDIPDSWFDEENLKIYISRDESYSNRFISLRTSLQKHHSNIQTYIDEALFIPTSKMSDYSDVECELKRVNNYIEQDILFSIWRKYRKEDLLDLYKSYEEEYEKFKKAKKSIDENYTEDIYKLDYSAIGDRFVNEYHPILKKFNPNYKSDCKKINECLRQERKLKDSEILMLINELKGIKILEDEHLNKLDNIRKIFGSVNLWSDSDFETVSGKITQYKVMDAYYEDLKVFEQSIRDYTCLEDDRLLYGDLYKGVDTDWSYINSNLEWFTNFKSNLNYFVDEDSFVRFLCSHNEPILQSTLDSIHDAIADLKGDLHSFMDLFDNEESMKMRNIPLRELINRYSKCCDNFALLEEWIDYNELKEEFTGLGLREYMDEAIDNCQSADEMEAAFKSRFFKLWLDAELTSHKAVNRFRSNKHNGIIQQFRQDDETVLAITQQRILSDLINRLPDTNIPNSRNDEINILRRELQKKRKIMPIRVLFSKISNLLFALKPCLMMSPLSVSKYLDPEIHKFDLVVFDEASQITTANAVGAIALGKQVIIAGDSKQLPPTNFFETNVDKGDYDSKDDDEDNDEWEIYESLLEEANCFPTVSLRWHYRSKNENLIAFSNVELYRNDLITFPSNKTNSIDEGVSYHYVPEGRYDRGGRSGNKIEAEKIAEMVFDHFRRHPERSLGVIAFGITQQNAIEDALEMKRIEDSSLEEFFRENREEPFFVKNLETVQGDERDTIILSIGYAKDNIGRLALNFGPLNLDGGEKRLNVAVTRAKYNLKLVGSILPTEMNVEKSKSDGLKLLRKYIEYAQKGPEVLNIDIKENEDILTESPFEESVLRFLESKDYKVATQVGCSGYRIDLAIKHPDLHGVYVLGIECDGASYHSSRTARERDRLRQQILENMGWSLYRIWSTDWIKDPKTEKNKLVEAVEKALDEYQDFPSSNEVNDEATIGSIEAVSQEDDTDYIVKKSTKYETNPYGFEEYHRTNYTVKKYYSETEKCECILTYIRDQYPIHFDQLCHDLILLLNKSKVTESVKQEFNTLCSSLIRADLVLKKGEFLYPKDYSESDVKVRVHSGRKIEYFSLEELSKAVLTVAQKSFGVTEEGLIKDTAIALSLPKTNPKVLNRLNAALDKLVDDSSIKIVDGIVSVQ